MTIPATTTDTGTQTTTPATDASATPPAATATETLLNTPATTTATDKPPADGKPADGSAAKPEGAPEAYAPFEMPEGIVLDADLSTEFGELAKSLNLPQDKAQSVAAMGAKLAQRIGEQMATQAQQQTADWAMQAKADPDIGGTKLTATVASAQLALKTYGSDGLKSLMDTSGLGNHPDVLKFFAKVGQTLSPDTIHSGGESKTQSIADLLYSK
jgi:hypothetical protein